MPDALRTSEFGGGGYYNLYEGKYPLNPSNLNMEPLFKSSSKPPQTISSVFHGNGFVFTESQNTIIKNLRRILGYKIVICLRQPDSPITFVCFAAIYLINVIR